MTDNTERVAIFIDGANFYRRLKENIGFQNICFYELAKKLVNKRKIVGIYYYNAVVNQEERPDDFKKQQQFFRNLEREGIKLFRGRISKVSGKEKEVDVKMAVDMIEKAMDNEYDTAIIVSGDGDFVHAVRMIKNKLNKRVENARFHKGCSSYLMNECSSFKTLVRKDFTKCKYERCSQHKPLFKKIKKV